MADPVQEAEMFVEFYLDAVELTFESEREGRPIYKDVPFVKILNPGDTSTVIERVATPEDRQKYPKAWQRFQNSETGGSIGTPLDKWPQINRAMMKEAKYFEIHTVEQLAAITDQHISRMGMGFRDLRTKAQAYLAAAKESAPVAEQALKIERLEQMVASLTAQLEAAPKRGPGRPPKDPE